MRFSRPLLVSALAYVAVSWALPGGVAPAGEGAVAGGSGGSRGNREGGEAANPASGNEGSNSNGNANAIDGGNPAKVQVQPEGDVGLPGIPPGPHCKRSGCGSSGDTDGSSEPVAPAGFNDDAPSENKQGDTKQTDEVATEQCKRGITASCSSKADISDEEAEVGPRPGLEADSSRDPVGDLANRNLNDPIKDKTYPALEGAGYAFKDHNPNDGTPFALSRVDRIQKNMRREGGPGGFKDMHLVQSSYRGKGVASSDHPNNQEIIWVDVDPENGHAIVQGKYKSRDTNPAENQLPVSELIGQTIKSVFPGRLGGSLKAVTEARIMNDDTTRVIRELFPDLSKSSSQYKMVSQEDNANAWNRLANSDNGKTAFRYANDHFKEDQGWKPVKLHVVDPGSDNPTMTWEYGSTSAKGS